METKDLFAWHPDQGLENWLALQCCKGLGYRKLHLLAELCEHNFERLVFLSEKEFQQIGLSAVTLSSLKAKHSTYISTIIDWLRQSSQHFILPLNHPDYPDQLKQISRPPILLFGIGDVHLLREPQLGIVGSRHHSPAGGKFANNIAKELVHSGWVITSGLALGIDTQGHLGTLEANGKTIAVMATGIDQIYPKRNQQLAERILANGGCLVTEMAFGAGPKKEHFPRRNRIISGLSKGILVVEAAIKSGSLVTAKYALEQNREVFAVPGSVYNLNSSGCHQLIKQGAKLTEQVSDINEEFPNIRQCIQKTETKMPEKNCDLPLATDHLLASVGFEATPIDVVAQRSGLPVTAVMSELLEYELRGLVATVPGGYIRLGE